MMDINFEKARQLGADTKELNKASRFVEEANTRNKHIRDGEYQ